jgi:NAD-dependent SIR2 family protein deacetylase
LLVRRNGGWSALAAQDAPDGDADLEGVDFAAFKVPGCAACGGLLKPGVVFFGEAVPKPRVERALSSLAEADSLLVAGSSLMVWSGYRFVKAAVKRGIPVGVLNLGRTRADQEIAFRVSAHCGEALPQVVR